jgi:TonB family protein
VPKSAEPPPGPAPAAAETAPRPSPAPAPSSGGEQPRVASVPRGDSGAGGAPRATPDLRAALRRGGGGGAGGLGIARGGIEGEPIPLDTDDPKYNDYLDRIRRMIKAKWGYPCVKSPLTRECEYKTTHLVVEFGILKDGRLQFVDVRQSSGLPIYDDYAVNAIKLAEPFPDVPSAMMSSMKKQSTGIAILARFNYVVETSLTNLLR